MKQLYANNTSNYSGKPKQETIAFLLSFSKSLQVVKTQKTNKFIELHLN